MRKSMAGKKADPLQGTLDLLVLKALALGPLHGLGVSQRIEQVTRGTFKVKPGSLFPALHRMEEAGWLQSSWGGPRTTAVLSTIASRKPGGGKSKSKPSLGSGLHWRSRVPSSRHRESWLCPYGLA